MLSYICSSRCSLNLIFLWVLPTTLCFLPLFGKLLCDKMAAELDFGCVHSPTGTEQEGSKVRGREVIRQEG